MAPKEKEISEKFLHWLWENQFLISTLITEEGAKIEILSPGIPNLEDGPDFKYSIISFNNTITEGDIEIHFSNSDWFNHEHHLDPKYNNVVLHIVWHYDSHRPINSLSTLLLSKHIPAPLNELLKIYKKKEKRKRVSRCLYSKDTSQVLTVLESEGINRFFEKTQKFSALVKIYDWEQAIYVGIMESLGYIRNEFPFIRLANLVSIQKLRSLCMGKPKKERIRIIKSSLLGAAGLVEWKTMSHWNKIKNGFIKTMKKEEWQFFKVRPLAFPTRRIEEISYFIGDTIIDGIWNFFRKSFPNLDKIEDKLSQGGIGKTFARTIIFNVYLPMMANFCGPENILPIWQDYKRLPENSITKLMTTTLFRGKKRFKNEIYYQGMLRIFYKYCKIKQCNFCPIKL
jgi:hypothetical protein